MDGLIVQQAICFSLQTAPDDSVRAKRYAPTFKDTLRLQNITRSGDQKAEGVINLLCFVWI